MSLEDRDALRVLRDAFRPDEPGGVSNSSTSSTATGLLSTFRYAICFRPKWPPSEPLSARHCTGFTANCWHSALPSPVAFLQTSSAAITANTVCWQTHYETLRRALYAALRTRLGDAWTAAVDAAAGQSLNLIIGVMSGAADADEGPAWWDGTVIEHHRVSRDLAVVRLRLDRPMHYHPGQYINVHIPQCPR